MDFIERCKDATQYLSPLYQVADLKIDESYWKEGLQKLEEASLTEKCHQIVHAGVLAGSKLLKHKNQDRFKDWSKHPFGELLDDIVRAVFKGFFVDVGSYHAGYLYHERDCKKGEAPPEDIVRNAYGNLVAICDSIFEALNLSAHMAIGYQQQLQPVSQAFGYLMFKRQGKNLSEFATMTGADALRFLRETKWQDLQRN